MRRLKIEVKDQDPLCELRKGGGKKIDQDENVYQRVGLRQMTWLRTVLKLF